MYNQLNVLFQYYLMLIQLFYVQNQRYLIDFDELIKEDEIQLDSILIDEEFHNQQM